MASKVVDVYGRHQNLFDDDAKRVWNSHPNPFKLPNLHITESVDESMAINRIERGAIVIAGSGMANAGRILHHLKHRLHRRQTHVVFVGYQAEGTTGRRLVDGAKWVRIHGHDVRVNAQRHTVGGLSAHTDQRGLMDWYGQFRDRPALALVHGEDKAREALAGELGEAYGITATLARPGLEIEV
jgi:metallo-beta-lactamase family protein